MRGRRSQIGDRRVAPNGYHYVNTADGWQLTHRVVMEEHLGRKLTDNERVVFKNGNKDDISISNLEVRVKKQRSNARRRAQLEARLEEIKAQLAELD